MHIRSIYYRIIKAKKLRVILAVLVFMFVAAGLAGLSFSKKMANSETRARFLRENPVAVKLLPFYWSVRKISDITYLPYFFKQDSVPAYSLEIVSEDLQTMNDSLPQGFMNVVYTEKVYVPAKFYSGGREYDVQVRYRGDNAIHWNAPKRSYHVRFDKDDLFEDARELAFIIVTDRKFALEHLNNYRAAKFGLRTPESGFANLTVNGTKGLYFTIEGWSDEMLEGWGLPKGSVLYGDRGTGEAQGALWEDREAWKIQGGKKNYQPLEGLLRLLNQADDNEFFARIFELIDQDSFSNWQIHQQLANSAHQNHANMKIYFDTEKEKLFFIPWDVEIGDPEEQNNFGVYSALAERIFENSEFLAEKNRRLLEYVSDDKNLEDDLRFYDETYESFKTSLYRDRSKIYSNRQADADHLSRRQMIIDIFYKWREILEKNNGY